MKSLVATILLSVVLVAVSGDFQLVEESDYKPAPPQWPNQFTQNFTDHTLWLTGYHHTKATFYYDWTNQKYKIYRNNGKYDRYCGTNGLYEFYTTPCEHIVVNGSRYLYYPEYDDCCFCCDAAHGCGLIRPDWLSDAKFEGNKTYKRDKVKTPSFEWEKDGVQSNYYYETQEASPLDRIMLEINMEPNEKQKYDYTRLNTVEDIQLPSKCERKHKCSLFSACASVQGY